MFKRYYGVPFAEVKGDAAAKVHATRELTSMRGPVLDILARHFTQVTFKVPGNPLMELHDTKNSKR